MTPLLQAGQAGAGEVYMVEGLYGAWVCAVRDAHGDAIAEVRLQRGLQAHQRGIGQDQEPVGCACRRWRGRTPLPRWCLPVRVGGRAVARPAREHGEARRPQARLI
jgi:hypothetical protein